MNNSDYLLVRVSLRVISLMYSDFHLSKTKQNGKMFCSFVFSRFKVAEFEFLVVPL